MNAPVIEPLVASGYPEDVSGPSAASYLSPSRHAGSGFVNPWPAMTPPVSVRLN